MPDFPNIPPLLCHYLIALAAILLGHPLWGFTYFFMSQTIAGAAALLVIFMEKFDV